jgi:hypothetical protein
VIDVADSNNDVDTATGDREATEEVAVGESVKALD